LTGYYVNEPDLGYLQDNEQQSLDGGCGDLMKNMDDDDGDDDDDDDDDEEAARMLLGWFLLPSRVVHL
jgi:hypothetical protein